MSSDEPRELAVLQRWLQAVITHPLGVARGIGSPAARGEIELTESEIESVIERSRSQTSLERLAVYGNAYYARLLQCMREQFPALVHALSEEVFDQFAFGYLQQFPPRGYTLDRLADRFVEHLEQTRPDLQSAAGTAAWPDLVIDLARLESTIGEVFDGPGVEDQPPLTAEQLAAIPAQRWAAARLEPVVCLRLLALRFPVNAFYTALRQGAGPPLPAPGRSYLAVWRRAYVVRRLELSQPQYELLRALVAGETVGEAISRCAAAVDDLGGLERSLLNWFRSWSAAGLFQAVRLEPD